MILAYASLNAAAERSDLSWAEIRSAEIRTDPQQRRINLRSTND
jgi:hypothetical protein